MDLKLIAGLGNPGNKYLNTRHNVGFLAVDQLKESLGAISCQSRFEAEVCETHLKNQKIHLLKPLKYMNLSGEVLGAFARYYQIEPSQSLIIYDDLDLPNGKLRLAYGGGHGGHRGIESLSTHWSPEFWRLRIGIGDNRDHNLPAEQYVLQKFSEPENEQIKNALKATVKIVTRALDQASLEELQQMIAAYNQTLTSN